MSKISEDKSKKIKEAVLSHLFHEYPKMLYTYEIADSLVRDDEFILRLLIELDKNKLVKKIEESSGGKIRRKWGLSKVVHQKYKELI